jgi:hypothetical protein
MCAIKITHNLINGTTPKADAADKARSFYCYLFNDLANDRTAGLLAGTDETETIRRLRLFVDQTPTPFTPPAPVFMRLPAAYTYFGQFMNHDISAPIGGLLVNVGDDPAGIIGTVDPAGLEKGWRAETKKIIAHFRNEHTAPLTLGSLYGDGPGSHDPEVAQLYMADGKSFVTAKTSRATPESFVEMKHDPQSVIYALNAPDIPRRMDATGTVNLPLIADLRNDGNLILCQLHLAFMLVHNKAVIALQEQHADAADCFRAARQLVTLHYHWLILNDYLPNLLSESVLTKPLSHRAPSPEIGPNEVPMEFTTAAFRFGHSMVGRSYDFNANFGSDGRLSTDGASLSQLFNFTSHGNMADLPRSSIQLPDHWVIDWDRMTSATEPRVGGPASLAEKIDLDFAPDMLNSAGDAQIADHGSIMFRNLMRGFHRRMPFGQKLAEACDIPTLSSKQILRAMQQEPSADGDKDAIAKAAQQLGFLEDTPAWLYFLCESKALESGERVGPTASRIIADTIVSLMHHNPASILNDRHGSWHPGISELKTRDGKPLDTLRAFLMFATEPG